MNVIKYLKKLIIIVILLTLCVSDIAASPRLERGTFRYGFSPRIKRNSWGIVGFQAINPDSKDINVEVRLIDSVRGAINHNTVFVEEIYIPPKTIINYKVPMKTETAEEYSLELFANDKQVGKVDSFLISLISGNSEYMPILNDSLDISLGSFITTKEFKGLYSLSLFTVKTPPKPWSLLKKSAALIVLQPDFSKYSNDTFQAILDYVYQGGNIIFADPLGVIAAAKTPLVDLLPVIPTNMRKISNIKSLNNMIPEFKNFPKPVNFLESIPIGNGVTFLEDNSMPLFRWKKYGLGTSRFSAIPIIKDSFKNNVVWCKLLKIFFAHQVISNDLATSLPVLEEMTGFTVPSVDVVKSIFLTYFIIILVPLGLGFYFKRTGIAWILTGFLTILFSIYVLMLANKQHSSKEGVFVSFIEATLPGVNVSPAEGWYSIFSTSDKSIIVEAKNNNTLLSSIPPPDTIMSIFQTKGTFGGGKGGAEPTEVKLKNGVPAITGLTLNANMSRYFYGIYGFSDKNYYDSPVLVYKKDGLFFEKWNIPSTLKPIDAWIQFVNGGKALSIKNGAIVDSNLGNQLLSTDNTMNALHTFVDKGWKHSTPALIIVENASKTLLDFPDDVIAHGKRIVAIPLIEKSEEPVITIPPQSILLLPGDTSSRLVMNGNDLKKSIITRTATDYVFTFQLPPLFSQVVAENITINCSIINEGGNIRVNPQLFRGKFFGKNFIKKEIIKGEVQADGSYLFKDVSNVIVDGKGAIGLDIKLDRKDLPNTERMRVNKWSMDKLEIKIQGRIPNIESFKF